MKRRSRQAEKMSPVLLLLISLGVATVSSAQGSRPAADTVKNSTGIYSLPNKSKQYPVLFGGQSDNKLVQSIGYLKGTQLESTPASTPLYALTGRIAGLFTSQFSGEPNADDLSLSLRGQAPLIIIDGVPRSALSINPEQIESVTVLKDALATAMLGMRASNGAVMVTTKKGNSSKESFSLNFKAQAGVQTPTKMRQYLSAFDYATLYNEALLNDSKPAVYSQADLDAYRTGSDPTGHPDVDWTNTLLKKNAGFSRYTLNAEGSNRTSNYFVSLDYLNQGGLLKETDLNKYSTNSTFKRYIFRSNVEVNIDANLKVFLNLFGRIRTGNEPGVGSDNIFTYLNMTPNNAYPVFNPDGSLGGNINYQNNLIGQSQYSGYLQAFTRDAFVDGGFVRDMSDIAKGWWIKGMFSYNSLLTHETNRYKSFEVFKMNIGSAGDTTYQRYGTRSEQNNFSFVSNRTQQFYSELSTGINRSFGNNSFDAMLLANSDHYTSNQLLPETFKSLAANVQYSIKDKYIFQAAAAYSGNNRYLPGEQAGLFPSAGIAWNMHKEDFFPAGKFLNTVKLRASYGLTGNAVPGYYAFIQDYRGATGYVFGTAAGGVSGIQEDSLSTVRTWEKALKLNLGVDLTFANDRGWFSADYYTNKHADLLQRRGRNTSLPGIAYPMENLGKNRYSGIELVLGWTGNMGDLKYNVSGNFSVSQSEVLYNDEPTMPYANLYRTSQRVDQFYGYIADGFVTTAGQGPVVEGYHSIPGDLKYIDLNGDGVINKYDETALYNNKPVSFYGLNANLRWKNFFMSILFQGVANRQINLANFNGGTWEFQNNGKEQAYPHHLNRWTPATAATATYPRLSVGNNRNNNVPSTFWIANASFLRLRNAEVGYDFTGGIIRKAKLKGVKVFVNGLNLFTISSFDRADPETPFSNYPAQRVINGGVSITL